MMSILGSSIFEVLKAKPLPPKKSLTCKIDNYLSFKEIKNGALNLIRTIYLKILQLTSNLTMRKLELSPETCYTARIFPVTIPFQHCTRSFSLYNKTSKGNKRYRKWGERNKTVFVYR